MWEGARRVAPHLLGGHHAALPLLEPPPPQQNSSRRPAQPRRPRTSARETVSAFPGQGLPLAVTGGGSQSPPASEGHWGTPGPRSPLGLRAQPPDFAGGNQAPTAEQSLRPEPQNPSTGE